MDYKKEIGKRIRVARDRLGWSLEELARRTKYLKKSTIGNWEQGTRTPGPQDIVELSHALGVSAAYLMCLDEETSLSNGERALLEKYRIADNRGKDVIQSIADTESAYQSVSRNNNSK